MDPPPAYAARLCYGISMQQRRVYYEFLLSAARRFTLATVGIYAAFSCAACTPSMTERVSRDVARAFADSEFRRTDPYDNRPYDNRSTLDFMAADPRLRADAIRFTGDLGYSLGYVLGRMLVP